MEECQEKGWTQEALKEGELTPGTKKSK